MNSPSSLSPLPPGVEPRKASPSLRSRGVALVVTLLMLSVITVVVVTFLALSRRERASITQTINLTDSRTMADTALERSIGQFVAPIRATTNMLNFDLSVSRNYISPFGFQPGISDPTNASYVYANGQPLNQNDFLLNVANLQIDPRPPVFVRTNRPGTPLASEFRFYLDLNRSTNFDPSGYFLPFDDLGRATSTNFQYFVGDPEWIGVLERPNLPHSANNRFIGRYAYIILPVGKSLDLNFIHNESQALTLFGQANRGRFFRNQGFGTYEINLAAFLAQLNTNTLWFTNYYYQSNGICTGEAFFDALDMVQYRYVGDYNPSVDSLQAIFGPNAPLFSSDKIDGLARAVDDPLALVPPDDDDPLKLHSWPGASSRQHFYSLHDYFNRAKLPPYTNFIDRLTTVLGRNNSYDRYTFYRLLSQMGTDSTEEPQHADIPQLMRQISAQKPEEFLADTVGRINLNYDNINYIASDFTNWYPLTFFTNVGNILLREQFPFGITNIPVNTNNNWYVPSTHRLLQVAANIYDAATTDAFPTVFLPLVDRIKDPFTNALTTGVSGYVLCSNRLDALKWVNANTNGLPAVVGVKKGLPNFNEFVFQTFFQITRKLEVGRPATNALPNQTNQILLLSISNLFGVENWNSYSTPFTNDVQVFVSNNLSYAIIDANSQSGFQYASNAIATNDFTMRASTNGNWRFKPRFPSRINYDGGFMTPLYTNVNLLTNSRYFGGGFDDLTNSYTPRTGELPGANFHMLITNRITYIVSTVTPDIPHGRVIDLVCLSFQTNLNLSEFLTTQDNVYPSQFARLWDTNRIAYPPLASTPTEGIMQQLGISLGSPNVDPTVWKAYNVGTTADKDNAIAIFKGFVYGTNYASSNLFQQAPFTASRRFVHTVTWQANDPLVHYMAEDLGGTTNELRFVTPNEAFTNNLNLGRVNQHYQPWLGNPLKSSEDSVDPNDTYLGVKDPGVFGSDDWDFPSQKFPSIGWLGRIHRGTPWQTIYLKAEVAPTDRWLRQSPDIRTHPTNDWRLLDIFTVAQTPNVSHGQLSINQAGIAAWSAVLGGVTVISNQPPIVTTPARAPTGFAVFPIDPKLDSPVLETIVDSINRNRLARPNQVFRSLGEILTVPELTTKSPFLNFNADVAGNSALDYQQYTFNDEAYERIPRQILSLLKVGDSRFVVYSFGQSLKPADKSIVTDNPNFFGMCTNYQITGEVYTRALVKIEGTARNPKPVILNFNILPAD